MTVHLALRGAGESSAKVRAETVVRVGRDVRLLGTDTETETGRSFPLDRVVSLAIVSE
jgi:hypothetical protein